jgi:hypothetical protein
MNDQIKVDSDDKLCQFMPKDRSRGPYSKQEKYLRQNEVHRLHFEYGYSARKISELMNVNRNTINGDISYWYSKITSTHNFIDPEMNIIVNLRRLEVQRTRLRIEIDKTAEFGDKLALERLILDIDTKILQFYQKIGESSKRLMNALSTKLNLEMMYQKKDTRYMSLFDQITISDNAKKKIDVIIKEDKIPRPQQ